MSSGATKEGMHGSPLEIVHAIKFDAARLADAYRRLIDRHPIVPVSRGKSVLRCLSLTHRPSAPDPLYDGNNGQFNLETGERLYEEAEFSEFNANLKDTYFYEVYQSIPYRVGRVRLIVLPPLSVYQMHIDSCKRAHIPIETNPHAYILFEEGALFHLPADGSLYALDTTRPHTAINCGLRERVHLTMSIVGER
ncbi:hypothetical protein [Sorangium sp. So ce131]|uniref:hypothetical protein n=1 Tax=Sorangium sp. So ce131 TaxID=3133282 RepID=UPI003F624334